MDGPVTHEQSWVTLKGSSVVSFFPAQQSHIGKTGPWLLSYVMSAFVHKDSIVVAVAGVTQAHIAVFIGCHWLRQ